MHFILYYIVFVDFLKKPQTRTEKHRKLLKTMGPTKKHKFESLKARIISK